MWGRSWPAWLRAHKSDSSPPGPLGSRLGAGRVPQVEGVPASPAGRSRSCWRTGLWGRHTPALGPGAGPLPSAGHWCAPSAAVPASTSYPLGAELKPRLRMRLRMRAGGWEASVGGGAEPWVSSRPHTWPLGLPPQLAASSPCPLPGKVQSPATRCLQDLAWSCKEKVQDKEG